MSNLSWKSELRGIEVSEATTAAAAIRLSADHCWEQGRKPPFKNQKRLRLLTVMGYFS
ncbi:MAG: hypothetical protein K2X41_13585 [Hyphomicrobium sp.]|nr:hypothetical protein [Hyphomicrobium sp.]